MLYVDMLLKYKFANCELIYNNLYLQAESGLAIHGRNDCPAT